LCCAESQSLEECEVKKLSLTALAACVFAFAMTSSAEVVRSPKGKNKNQARIVPVVFTSAPAPALAGPGKGKAKKQKAADAVPQILAAPAISTVTTATKKHRGPGNAAVTGVSPLFLPVTNVTPTLASVSSSGVTTGHRFRKTVVNPPSTSSFVPVQFAAVPEPAYTSLALLGLFGAGLLMARRWKAGKTNPVAL
jgi:hypothetical protein